MVEKVVIARESVIVRDPAIAMDVAIGRKVVIDIESIIDRDTCHRKMSPSNSLSFYIFSLLPIGEHNIQSTSDLDFH